MTAINQELISNGDFATGDLRGWSVIEENNYKVVEYETGKYCVVLQSSSVIGDGLAQHIIADPGTYEFSIMHRSTDKDGQPGDVSTINGAAVSYYESGGGFVTRSMVVYSTPTWSKASRQVTLEEGEPPLRVKLSIQNPDNSRGDNSSPRNIESPYAVTGISFRKIR